MAALACFTPSVKHWNRTVVSFFHVNAVRVRGDDIGSMSLRRYPDDLKTVTKALVRLVLKTLVQFIRLS
jgi:hypothetical protein